MRSETTSPRSLNIQRWSYGVGGCIAGGIRVGLAFGYLGACKAALIDGCAGDNISLSHANQGSILTRFPMSMRV